jgi:serine/threonine protein kinase
MPLGRGESFAGYTIVRLLGSGGMGEVYLAEHPRLPRRDALKILPADVSADPDFRARFNREADLAATLLAISLASVRTEPLKGSQPVTPPGRYPPAPRSLD